MKEMEDTTKKIVNFVSDRPAVARRFRMFFKKLYQGSGIRTIPPVRSGTMLGAGMKFKGKGFTTHTTLRPVDSALLTFSLGQGLFIISSVAAFAAWFYFMPLAAIIGLIAALSAVYFVDVLFNLLLVIRSTSRPPEISFLEQELLSLNGSVLPKYTVLCPLYRESRVLPGFLRAMENLDWPKKKLEVLLLLEEDDKETLAAVFAADLPDYVRVIIVPDSMPKTKPKACNYGLNLAHGEYLVIYDAEDVPDPQQLKKAYLGFQKLPSSVKCLQAKLNYHNVGQNLLTRLFTAEYSLWFDVILPGLQSVRGYIPLGGTSNHFRIGDLRALRGWDPFNVTEDCDLGARIHEQGYDTAIIESVTYEEANSRVWNWLRQRSRWIKGYMQTYLVHMRHPFRSFGRKGVDAAMFQLVVGGKIMFLLINPLLWIATLSYFLLKATVGTAIEAVYPGPVFYIASATLVFGNFMHLFYYMIACAKRGQWGLIKYVFFVPFYWLMASLAALMALYQLVTKPHFWEKTQHGLDLPKTETEKTEPESVPAPRPALEPVWVSLKPNLEYESVEKSIPNGYSWAARIGELWNGALGRRTSILAASYMLANFLNFLFSIYIGRYLSFSDLAVITLVNTVWAAISIFLVAISSTVNHRTALLGATGGDGSSVHFLRRTMHRSVFVAAGISFVWMACVPWLTSFFHLDSAQVLYLFAPSLVLGVIAASYRGFLQGKLAFVPLSVTILGEALVKLLLVVGMIGVGSARFAYISIPGSVAFSALVAAVLGKRLFTPEKINGGDYGFPQAFYVASLMSGVSIAAFLSVDIIMAEHFLDSTAAGQYVLLSLIGKIIFFFGALPSNFLITFVSREEGAGRDPQSVLRDIFLATFALVTIGVVGFAVFGGWLVPILLGSKAFAILFLLERYSMAIGIFTLANVLVSYHLARRQYIFPLVSLSVSVIMAAGIWMNHASIPDIVDVVARASAFGFLSVVFLHLVQDRLVFAGRAVRDFVNAFAPEPQYPLPAGKRRILIFNWRDIRHVWAGGAEAYVFGMAREWAIEGHQVIMFTGNDGRSLREEMIDGVRIIRRGGFYFVYIWAFLYYLTRFRRRVDVIVDCHNGIPFFTPLYAGEPVYGVVHHVHQEVFRRSLRRPLVWLAIFLERHLMPVAYRNVKLVTVSESSKAEIERMGLTRAGVEVISPGVDLDELRVGNKSPTPLVLYLGRLKAYKSVDVLITAFRLVLDSAPDAELVIAGNGEEEPHLERLSEQLGIGDHIHFLGKVSNSRKIALLQNAWMLVNPSFMEGWGITTIEANACGTPVIAADVPGLRDSVRDMETGYLVPHGDTHGFASRILTLIEDHRLRRELSERSVEWAKRFEVRMASERFLAAVSIKTDGYSRRSRH